MALITLFPSYNRIFHIRLSENVVNNSFCLIQARFSKILRWIPDTPHAHSMNKLTHFDDLINYCLDNRDTLGKRDIIASLSYMRTLKNFNLSSKNFEKYNDYIMENLSKFDTNIHLLVHRYSILGYSPALISIYDNELKNKIGNLDNKSLCLISWSYAKNNVFIEELFDSIATIVLNRNSKLNLTDISLLLWTFAKINRKAPEEVLKLKNEFISIIKSIENTLNNKSSDENTQEYLDKEGLVVLIHEIIGSFYTNVVHDICMATKSLSILLPGDLSTISQVFKILFNITSASKLSITSQGITSLWEALEHSNLKDEHIIEKLCEASRYLRLDHSFNSNMLNSIVTSIYKLRIKDPRIIYQIVHWLEKRSVQMQASQMYNIICLLDQMCIYHDKAWKQLEIYTTFLNEMVSTFLITLISSTHFLYNLYLGKGNDRIYGILDHFMICKQDIEQFGFV
uniref:Uncharacterized protein n=1 Tax=Theileria annulata TaxID=5874 RepID=A0A3B0MEU7_THEAN